VLFGNQTWGKVVMDLRPDDVVLGVLPYSHNYGLYAGLLAPLLLGAKVALVEHFSPDKLLGIIERLRVTVFPGVATMFSRLLNLASFSKTRLSTLRVTTSGAAPCSDALCKEWRAATGVRILCGYGATEVPRTLSYLPNNEDDMPGAAGKIVPGVEFRVVDETDRPLPEGEVGELLIKSPSAMDGYLDHPAETREVLSDGWYRTGDLGAILPGGFVRLAGRKRERILRGGYSVFPQEIETVLLTHAAIAEAAVVGVPHADLGEEVAAFVALKPAAQASSEEIIAYTKDHLAHHKYPRHVIIVEELPRGLTGKTLKSELLKRWVAQ
jgi:long-chain acyl-CoA synthetase